MQPARLDTNGVTLGYITDTVDSTRNCCMLKANTHNAICLILLCYYEFERGCVQLIASCLLAFICSLTHAPIQHRIPTKTDGNTDKSPDTLALSIWKRRIKFQEMACI